ncbi:MAG: tyrosine-protein phosphatase [Candidatus Sericytochromatia bacterium]|nr:tyrosine-protein phosphatase [Candidatus Sericytochromatia bacterium]
MMVMTQGFWCGRRVNRPLAALTAALLLTVTACGGVPVQGNPNAVPTETPIADPNGQYPSNPNPHPTDAPYVPYNPGEPAYGFEPKTLVNPYDTTTGWGGVPREDLDNFQVVDKSLFRGARPSRQGMMLLKKLGIKTIVTLEKDDNVVNAEISLGQELGLKVINVPLGTILPPARSRVDEFLRLASSPGERPMYFHCKQGRDRTGAMAMAYRVQVEHWQPEYAYSEMIRSGFHGGLVLLKAWAQKYGKSHYTPAAVPPVIPSDIPLEPQEDPNPQDAPPATET